jgi:hypothetical protein
MKKIWLLVLICFLVAPFNAFAEDEIEDVIESDVGPVVKTNESKTPASNKTPASDDLAYGRKKAGYVKEPKETAEPEKRQSASVFLDGRKGHFRVGFIGPGYAVANKGAGSMMTVGGEGEYFFWEKLSAVMRIEVATDFDDITILSFVPRARYVFDLSSHPRWSVYVQGGVGLALYDGAHAAADIAIPGGGFWWQWTDRWSVGADTSVHIFARSDTAVGFTIAPAIRYQF